MPPPFLDRLHRLLPVAGLCLLLMVLLPTPSWGQITPGMVPSTGSSQNAGEAAAEPEDPAATLLRLLEDPELRDQLRATLGAEVEPEETAEDGAATGEFAAHLGRVVAGLNRRLETLTTGFNAIPQEYTYAKIVLGLEFEGGKLFIILASVTIFLLVGYGLEALWGRLLRPTIRRIAATRPKSPGAVLKLALVRFVLIASGVIVFALGSIGAFLAFPWQPIIQVIVLNALSALLMTRITMALARFVFAPDMPHLRLLPIGDRGARSLARWSLIMTTTGAFGVLTCDALYHLGLFPQSHILFVTLVGLALLVILACALLSMRRGMPAALHRFAVDAGSKDTGFAHGVIERAPLIGLCLVAVMAVLWTMGAVGMMMTVATLALWPIADLILRQALAKGEAFHSAAATDPVPDQSSPAPPPAPLAAPLAATPNGGGGVAIAEGPVLSLPPAPAFDMKIFLPALSRASRVALAAGAVGAIALFWGYDLAQIAESQSRPSKLFNAALSIAVTLVLADMLWTLIKSAINARLAAEGGLAPADDGGGEGGGAGGSRLQTLLPLGRLFIGIFLASVVIMIVLSEIGVDIGPLLAGAGVVGIAVGFGAQALVRDIFSGIFFLIDDAFRIGEYLEIGETRGTVENISLRSLRLRHHRGAVHTVPFGEIPSMTNYSRDWVMMKLEFRIPFDTDMQRVKKLIKGVAAELQEHPDIGQHMLEPLKSQGVRRMEEFNMVLGVKFKCRPGQQWVARREAYHKILKAFEGAGIGLAARQVTVNLNAPGETGDDEAGALPPTDSGGPTRALSEKEKQLIAAAAVDAVEPPIEQPGPPGSSGGAG